MHKLLARQIGRLLGANEAQLRGALDELRRATDKQDLSPQAARLIDGMDEFLERVGATYEQNDRDLDLRSRSLALSSMELTQINSDIRQLNNTLEQRVAERSQELETAMDKLQQSQQELARSETRAALSTQIASVTHELNTPLGNSLMTASTLVDQSNEFLKKLEANQMRRSDLSNFVGATREGNALVLRNLQRASELLGAFRQVANDHASGERRVFDLATMVDQVTGTLAPSLKRHAHQVLNQIPAGILIDGPPGALGQITINLINNAYLHGFEARHDGVLTITAQAEHQDVVLRFADNGVGMGEESLARLFEPFFSTKKGKGGTGLGMSIVENLVREALGGTITVQSEPGVGTCFEIRLPLVSPLPKP